MFTFQLLVRSSLRNDGSRPTYRLLGYLSVIQLSITLLLTTYQVKVSTHNSVTNSAASRQVYPHQWRLLRSSSLQNILRHMGSRDSAVMRALASHHCILRSIAAQCHLWVEFVIGSGPAPRRIFLPVLRFSTLQKKPTSLNSNSTRIEGLHKNQLRLMWSLLLIL